MRVPSAMKGGMPSSISTTRLIGFSPETSGKVADSPARALSTSVGTSSSSGRSSAMPASTEARSRMLSISTPSVTELARI
ncbi:hypothetical protein D3C72_2186210 [compost metagenome]